MYITLDDSNTLIRRLLNNEAEIPKGITHVNEGITLSVHVRATASAEKPEHTEENVFKKIMIKLLKLFFKKGGHLKSH